MPTGPPSIARRGARTLILKLLASAFRQAQGRHAGKDERHGENDERHGLVATGQGQEPWHQQRRDDRGHTTASRGGTGGGATQTRRIDFRSSPRTTRPKRQGWDADSSMPKPSTAATEPAWEKANAATADTARNTLRVFLRPQISTSHAARK